MSFGNIGASEQLWPILLNLSRSIVSALFQSNCQDYASWIIAECVSSLLETAQSMRKPVKHLETSIPHNRVIGFKDNDAHIVSMLIT